jgi:hypothetical protein
MRLMRSENDSFSYPARSKLCPPKCSFSSRDIVCDGEGVSQGRSETYVSSISREEKRASGLKLLGYSIIRDRQNPLIDEFLTLT